MNTKYKILIVLMLLGFSSCKKWLDVKPKNQVESDENFKNEQGFKDALTGVYLTMVNPQTYGKELSFGMIEALGKNYTQFNSIQTYFQDSKYNYAFGATKSRIDNLWKNGYNTIANINNLIENLEKADKKLFDGHNYEVIKGEAYGLRAFNHFDLLRLFGPSPAAGGNALAIPYKDKYEYANSKQSTVNEVIDKVISDLKIAAALLKTSDPIVSGNSTTPSTVNYLRDRHYKFNYYAVVALQARAYLYKGDLTNALICAKEVISSNKFPATPANVIINGDKIMSSEVIFDLYLNNLALTYDQNFSAALPTGMYLSANEWTAVYESNSVGSADYRLLYQTETYGTDRYSIKFKPAANSGALNRLPLMRVSEMYYIAAESLKSTDPNTAIDYLNTKRTDRNLLPLPYSLTTQQIQDEIFKEYRKEFITEGQLFFYYKRLNLAKIEFTQVVGGPAIYVLPKPDDEIEYGAKQ